MKDAADSVGVARASPAEGEQRQAARVLAALDRMHPRGAGHALVDKLMDAPGRAHRGHIQWGADPRLDRAFSGSNVELQAPAEKEVWVKVAEQQVGVGDGGLAAAAAVTGRPRVGARAV